MCSAIFEVVCFFFWVFEGYFLGFFWVFVCFFWVFLGFFTSLRVVVVYFCQASFLLANLTSLGPGGAWLWDDFTRFGFFVGTCSRVSNGVFLFFGGFCRVSHGLLGWFSAF